MLNLKSGIPKLGPQILERNFGRQIRYATDKAEKSIATWGKLMPNDGGPTSRTRKILLNGVANSIILYGIKLVR